MTDDRRALNWHSFEAAFANVGVGLAGKPTLGVAPDICPCCDERYVVIAATDANGAEVNVSLTPETALAVAQRILDSYEAVRRAAASAAARQ